MYLLIKEADSRCDFDTLYEIKNKEITANEYRQEDYYENDKTP